MPKVDTGGAYWVSRGGQVQLYLGDVLERLRSMPSGVVQTAVTSPPYWGLRDYGTGEWKGGDPNCPHKVGTASDPSRLVSKDGHTPVAGWTTRDSTVRLNAGHKSNPVHKEGYKSPFRGTATGGSSYLEQGKMTAGSVPHSRTCPLGCGAKCEDHQLGSEASPDCLGWARGVNCAEKDWANACHVCRMVLVCREVRRVLRDDGTFWVNYGSTYFSGAGGKNPTQSLESSRAHACGTDGIKPGDSPVSDSFYRDLCDGCLSALSNRRVRNGLPPLVSSLQPEQRDRGRSRENCAGASPASLPPSSRRSTTPSSSSSGQAASSRADSVSVHQTAAQTSSCSIPPSSHKTACNDGTSQTSYSSAYRNQGRELSCKACGNSFKERVGYTKDDCTTNTPNMYTSGDLVAVPWLVALALQADGWILRSDIPWLKRSSMPESVRNRPAKALEYVFLLVKKMGYQYDCEAVRRVTARTCVWDGNSNDYYRSSVGDLDHMPTRNHSARMIDEPGVRNWRNADLWFQSVDTPHGMTWVDEEIVGMDVTSQAYEGQHFATFGSKLIEPMIKAGTSERGACAKCGAPWRRVLTEATGGSIGQGAWTGPLTEEERAERGNFKTVSSDGYTPGKTVGWEPTCECHGRFVKQEVWVERPVSLEAMEKANQQVHEFLDRTKHNVPGRDPISSKSTLAAAAAIRDRSLPQNRNGITGSLDGVERPTEKVKETRNVYIPSIPLEDHPVVPCLVLDPFMGSGTTALVSLDLGLRCWGIDLSREYMEQHAIKRVKTWFLNKGAGNVVPPVQVSSVGEEG